MFVPMLDLLILAAAGAAAPLASDCRTISESAARLACYDAREAASSPPPAPASQPTPSAPNLASQPRATPQPAHQPAPAPAPTPSGASSASVVRADPSGQIVAVAPLRYGLFRLTLADGRAFDTATDADPPPPIGTTIRLRRSMIGTTFLDAPGRSPITVRLVRQDH